ncbi:MAG TPA: energy transducer TonB, partial [Lacunisphaera sp.]|nr:energy transducer TonB [Lacunisphaera sp.]
TLCSFALVASASALSVSEITDVSPKVDEPPAPVRTFMPEYPDSLRNAKVNGLVSVMIVIDETGDVIAAEVAKTSHEDFAEPAVTAVRRWKFKPAKLEGKSVKVKVTIPVRFAAS